MTSPKAFAPKTVKSSNWPNAQNAELFAELAHRLYDWLESTGLPLPVLIVNLEPNLADSQHFRQLLLNHHLPELWNHLRQQNRRERLLMVRYCLNRLIVDLHQRGTQAWAVTYPLVVDDALAGNTV